MIRKYEDGKIMITHTHGVVSKPSKHQDIYDKTTLIRYLMHFITKPFKLVFCYIYL